MKLKRVAILVAVIGLAGCGQVAPLEPRPGQPLPVKPLMASATPTAEQLLTPPPYARPDRVDELVKRSAPRRVDRFDLPPPDGVAAPPPIEEEETSSNQAGPVTPE
ncbi:MAG TPA: hypothetical protein VFK50_07210 [Sphingomicrobium sp.]|nr:hypothetical protein [Sphingomicrobium sp.]